jgi:hypothetical protein
MIPGALLGLGCGALSQHRSQLRGIVCGVAALALGFYSEWHYKWFVADDSYWYLVTHFTEKAPITQVMLVLGALFAYWFGKDSGLRLGLGGVSRARSVEKTDPPASA